MIGNNPPTPRWPKARLNVLDQYFRNAQARLHESSITCMRCGELNFLSDSENVSNQFDFYFFLVSDYDNKFEIKENINH